MLRPIVITLPGSGALAACDRPEVEVADQAYAGGVGLRVDRTVVEGRTVDRRRGGGGR